MTRRIATATRIATASHVIATYDATRQHRDAHRDATRRIVLRDKYRIATRPHATATATGDRDKHRDK
jgi:hypothetical protein